VACRVVPGPGGGSVKRKVLLINEYLNVAGAQPPLPPPPEVDVPERPTAMADGQSGQLHAVWTHSLSKAEREAITGGGFPRVCAHGRHDIVSCPRQGEKLAAALVATGITLEGAHFLTRECGHTISLFLEENILGQARSLERQHLDRSRHMTPNIGPSGCSGVENSGSSSPSMRPADPLAHLLSGSHQ
jgi:hypothetical protein